MSSVYVHAGYGRTATTFLQRQVFPQLAGVCYYNKQKSSFIKAYTLTGDPTHLETARRFESAADGATLLFSDEGLTAHSPYSQISRLHEMFPDGIVVLTIRNQVDSLYSRYSHEVLRTYHARGYWDVPSYEEWIGLRGGFLSGLLSYNMMYQHLRKYFENVRVLFFEEYTQDLNLVAQCCDSTIPSEANIQSSKDTNASAHKLDSFLRQYNLAHGSVLSKLFFRINGGYGYGKCQSLVPSLKCVPDDVLDVPVAGVSLREIFMRDNEKFQKSLGQELPGEYFWPQTASDGVG